MPKLGSFLVCEKIILDQLQKPTLISLFQNISALVPEGQETPKDMIAAVPWGIFCEWFFAEDEMPKAFEQVIEVNMPDGSPSPVRGRLLLKEKTAGGQGSRVYVHLFGMPMSQPGFISVNVWLESGSEKVTDIFSYKIKIEHTKEPPKPDDGGVDVPAYPSLTQVNPQQ